MMGYTAAFAALLALSSLRSSLAAPYASFSGENGDESQANYDNNQNQRISISDTGRMLMKSIEWPRARTEWTTERSPSQNWWGDTNRPRAQGSGRSSAQLTTQRPFGNGLLDLLPIRAPRINPPIPSITNTSIPAVVNNGTQAILSWIFGPGNRTTPSPRFDIDKENEPSNSFQNNRINNENSTPSLSEEDTADDSPGETATTEEETTDSTTEIPSTTIIPEVTEAPSTQRPSNGPSRGGGRSGGAPPPNATTLPPKPTTPSAVLVKETPEIKPSEPTDPSGDAEEPNKTAGRGSGRTAVPQEPAAEEAPEEDKEAEEEDKEVEEQDEGHQEAEPSHEEHDGWGHHEDSHEDEHAHYHLLGSSEKEETPKKDVKEPEKEKPKEEPAYHQSEPEDEDSESSEELDEGPAPGDDDLPELPINLYADGANLPLPFDPPHVEVAF